MSHPSVTLSPEEEHQARVLRVWSVVETVSLTQQFDADGRRKADPVPHRVVSWHWTEASATEDQQQRGGPPGTETLGFRVAPASLLEAFHAGAFSPEEVRRRLAYQHGPLTHEEETRAARLRVWIVWYEDTFGYGEDRDPPGAVGFHLDESAARDEAAERGGVQEGSFERYTVSSSVLLDAFKDPRRRQPGILRDLLRQSEPRERKELLARVCAFVSRETRRAESALSPEMSLISELGLDGPIAAEFMAKFFTEFGVAAAGFDVARHYVGPEGLAPTLDDLCSAAFRGRWA